MKLSRYMHAIFLMVCLLMILIGCSGGSKNPIQPVSDDPSDQTFFSETGNDLQARQQIAVYDAVIDKDAGTFEITPVDREGSFHFPLSQLVPNVLQITGYGFTSTFWADIKLSHPYPGSGIVGFDPRVIAIVPANLSHYMYYPVSNVIANNDIVLEPDGYTKMYDNLGGSITGNTNPFKSYFTSQPYHAWMSSGMTQDTKRWNLYLGAFEGSLNFKLVVDVCTNYPNPPQQVVDNAPEPVKLSLEIADGLLSDGGSATVTATFLDWQGPDEIICKVEAPDLFTGAVELFYSSDGPNPNEYVFTGEITNQLGADVGEYGVLLAAWDTVAGNHVFTESVCQVGEFLLEDVSPPYLNLNPLDISTQGNYAYIAGGETGLHIIDISDPFNPQWFNTVDVDYATYVYVSGDYAYVGGGMKLGIIDINPPESAYEVNYVWLGWGSIADVYVANGYAYLANNSTGLEIIDIDPPQTAQRVKIVDTSGEASAVVVSGEYAYVADGSSGLQIIDIVPPSTASVIKTVATPGYAIDLDYSVGYVYVSDGSPGFPVIDVDPPSTASIVHNVNTGAAVANIDISGTIAFGTGYDDFFYIIDISTPESAYVMNTVETGGWPTQTDFSGEYAFVANYYTGLQVIDIVPPESAFIVSTLDSMGSPEGFCVADGYAYVADSYDGLKILDIDPVESTHIVKIVDTPVEAIDVSIANGYAYVADYEGGFHIIDIDPIESAYIVNSIETPDDAVAVDVKDGYAYLSVSNTGLAVIDIDPAETASIVHTVPLLGRSWHLDISGNYAYVANKNYGLQIIDITIPESAFVLHCVDTMAEAHDVHADGRYAYVTDPYNGMHIVDIEDPASAYVVNTVILEYCYGVFASGSFAFVTLSSEYDDLAIIDVSDPDNAEQVTSFDVVGLAEYVRISGNYAYVASSDGGFRIIKLW